MSDNKLQELIDTLKKQGVESGEESSRRIVEEANLKASEIVAKAKAEADDLIARAKEESDKSFQQLHSSLEIAASQLLTDLKRSIEENLLVIPMKEKIDETLKDDKFLKELINTCVREYVKDPQRTDLAALVPKDQLERLEDFAATNIQSLQGDRKGDKLTLQIKSDGVAFGFVIGTKDGVVKLDFTDEAFLELFLKYLAPKFRSYFKPVDVKGLGGK